MRTLREEHNFWSNSDSRREAELTLGTLRVAEALPLLREVANRTDEDERVRDAVNQAAKDITGETP
jgi:hypothetical protein